MSGDGEAPGFIKLAFDELPVDEMSRRALHFYEQMDMRRTTRHFSNKKVPRELIELAIKTASTAPSGAHLQPWSFVAISNDVLQSKIRVAAEEEERRFYEDRVPEAWSEVLRPLGTDHIKAHLTEAPWVVVLFRQSKRMRDNGRMAPTYYSQESCGIAAGLFKAAVHNMGLTTLTHTPSPMGFLRGILDRPDHEHAMLIMPEGYPTEDAEVPDISRKLLADISDFIE